MTAASSTHQALVQACTCGGSRATSTKLLTAAIPPIAVGQRRVSVARRPPGRVVGAEVVLVIGAPSSVLVMARTLGAGRRPHAGEIARFLAGWVRLTGPAGARSAPPGRRRRAC